MCDICLREFPTWKSWFIIDIDPQLAILACSEKCMDKALTWPSKEPGFPRLRPPSMTPQQKREMERMVPPFIYGGPAPKFNR